MAVLTQKQARDQYIVDSFAQFLDRVIKQQYDPEVAATAGTANDISKSLLITKGKPTDPNVYLSPPVIAIEDMPAGKDADPYEIGTNNKFRYMRMQLYCFPALRSDGNPSDDAAYLLKAYVRDALSGVSIRIIDYSNPACTSSNVLYCAENMYIDHVTTPMDRGKRLPNAAEQGRFDVHILLRYPVAESIVT